MDEARINGSADDSREEQLTPAEADPAPHSDGPADVTDAALAPRKVLKHETDRRDAVRSLGAAAAAFLAAQTLGEFTNDAAGRHW